jgi:hypothetical protein
VVSGTYNAIDGSLEACNLTITGNLNFNNVTTNFVEVAQDLSISGTFTIGDTESLNTKNSLASITGSITKFENSTNLINNLDITYWSSSVANASIGDVFAGVDPNRIFYWDQAANGGVGQWLIASGTMTTAKGYIAEGPSAGVYPLEHVISFTGSPNNGTKRLNIIWNNDGNPSNDYNLVGNPYPSAIDADAFINWSENLGLDGTLWLWTHNTQNGGGTGQYTTDDYATYNLTGGTAAVSGGSIPQNNLGSGQGFMVRAISAAPEVVFRNNMRLSGQNTQFFRSAGAKTAKTTTVERDRIWLDLESKVGGAFNQILIGFSDKATDGHDRGYDGLKLNANFVSLYSKIDTVRYGIQSLSKFNIDKNVPLGFDTYITDPVTYIISIDKLEGVLKNNDIYLIDNELGITHDLKLAPYEFDVNGTGFFPDRFNLQFTKTTLGVDDLLIKNNFIVINKENAIQLRSNEVIKKLMVYDLMGRLLIDAKPNNSEYSINTVNIRKGTVLLINASFENGASVSKKAIRY